MTSMLPIPHQARSARGEVERALDGCAWRWSLLLSRWLDALVALETSE